MFKSLLLLHLRKALFYFVRTLTIEWTHRREYPAQISVHLHASAKGITRNNTTGQNWSCRTYRKIVWWRVTKIRIIKTKYFVLIDMHNRNANNSCAYTLEQNLVETRGLEPRTSCVWSRHSNQLSYASISTVLCILPQKIGFVKR